MLPVAATRGYVFPYYFKKHTIIGQNAVFVE